MNNSRKIMVLVIALLCAITVLACDLGSNIGGGGQQPPPPPPAGKPDLVVTDARFDPDPALEGKPFKAEFKIRNQGTGDAGLFGVVWHFDADTGVEDCKWEHDKLSVGETFSGNCTRTAKKKGKSPTRLTIDSKVRESNESNNEATPTLNVAGPPPHPADKPDLVFTSFQGAIGEVALGQMIQLQYEMKNVGTVNAGAFSNCFKILTPSGAVAQQGEVSFAGLNSNVSITASWPLIFENYVPRTIGNYTFQGELDCKGQVNESNEENNTASAIVSVR